MFNIKSGKISGLILLQLIFAAICWGQIINSPAIKITAEDINLPACKLYSDDKLMSSPAVSDIMSVLANSNARPWTIGSRDSKAKPQLFIVFKTPKAVGSLLVQSNASCQYLPAGEAVPDNPLAAKWIACTFPSAQSKWKLATLPADTSVQAVLLTLNPGWWYTWNQFAILRFYAPRLYNIVPDGVANGEADWINVGDLHPPIPHTAANIISGSSDWQSHGPDNKNFINRDIITKTSPTWFVVSWKNNREISAIRLDSNFSKYLVFAFKGPDGINPTVSGENDWNQISCSVRNDGDASLISFDPINTRGIKFLVTDSSDKKFGRIEGLHIYTDLQDKAVPERKVVEVKPPCTFTYTLPEDGYITVVIEDKEGKRVRNLLAREFHKAGAYTIGWDLKNEKGQMMPVDTYKYKILFNPGLKMKYQMTPYPNIENNNTDNSPWLNGANGSGGWLADHSAPKGIATIGDKVYIASCCAESGVALIETDLTGKKLWGNHNIIAWTGPAYMTADDKALYTAPYATDTDYVWRFALPGKKMDTMIQVNATSTRKRGIKGMAVRDGKLYLAINAGTNYLENAATADDVNLETSVPRYPVPLKTNKYDDPDPRSDFLRLLRLTATPPGNRGLITLDSTVDKRLRQHILINFNRPVPVGSMVFPAPDDKRIQMHVSILKPEIKKDKDILLRKDEQWMEIWKGNGPGWVVATAPENSITRAIRVSFDHGETDVEDEGADRTADDPEATEDENALTGPAWQAKLEGMKILRRRFANLFPTCKVTVNSGKVTPQGEWNAARTKPLTEVDPAIYMMEWEKSQTMRGLAIKEIDGKQTEIDYWTGPDDMPVDMNNEKYWTNVASYTQKTRYYYQPDQYNNTTARYMDGYVDFGTDITTRAIRMRVVEQWMWKEEGRDGCAGVRRDRGGDTLDPTRCFIYGVAPLQYLGGESTVDMLATERIEIYDTVTKKLVNEWPIAKPGTLTFAPNGSLYAISAGKVVNIDIATGTSTPLKLDVKKATSVACDKQGNLYVFDSAADLRIVKAFTSEGKLIRTIGTPGGRIAGAWDPGRFTSKPWIAVDLAIDSSDQLWVVESDFNPKRVSVWGIDGTFKKDLLGNTSYGGGGCLDPSDKNKIYYEGMEFTLDWKTGKSQIKGMTWMGNSPAGEMPIKIKDRQYLVTRPLFARQAVAVVYLLQDGKSKRVAAVGRAGNFVPLRTPEVLGKLGKSPIGNYTFMWSDLNDDGKTQADEVEFFEVGVTRSGSPGRFEETLSIDAGDAYRFEVKGFAPNGAPLYNRVKKPINANLLKLFNGNFFTVSDEPDRVITADGKLVWSYPSEGWGVHALTRAKPYTTAQVVAEFDVIGHETAPTGDLGEFIVTNTNTGDWHIYTADGMLAATIFKDMRSGSKPWSMPDHERGLDITTCNIGQEHFSGYFCKTSDNKFYAVAGHNHVSVVEVEGIDKFVRKQADLQVTPQMVQDAISWNKQQLSTALYKSAKIMISHPNTPKVDGNPGDWISLNSKLSDNKVSFGMSYDDDNLYVCYVAKDSGPIKNAGNDWKRLFKTGAAVDLQIGVDPKAAMGRVDPVVGDARILITMNNGKPVAVLYQPNFPGAKPEENWETHTGVFNANFDRVVLLPEVKIATGTTEDETGRKDGYCLEAAIPLKSIGLTIQHDMQLKMDWGILVSGSQGTEVQQRLYWANPLTAIVSDEASEAALHPDLWGLVRFSENPDKNDIPDPEGDL
jgi:hypothetical protein